MAIQVGALEAKTHLSRLLAAVQQGERVTITRRGRPVAVLVPFDEVRETGLADAISQLAALRERTRAGSESIRTLREEGRKW